MKMHDQMMEDLKLQEYFVFSVSAKFLGQIIGILFISPNLNSILKHHNYELKA